MRLLTASLVAFAAMAQAQRLQVGKVTTSGPGCPAGSVSTVADRSGAGLLVLFDAFTMQLPGTGVKDCAVYVNVSGVPKGQVPVFTVTARGFLALPKGSTANYRATGFWDHDAATTLVNSSHRRC
jgi:hypothetical protein